MSYDTPQDPMTVSTHGTTPTPAPTQRYELHHTFVGASMRECADGEWCDSHAVDLLERELASTKALLKYCAHEKSRLFDDFTRAKAEARAATARVTELERLLAEAGEDKARLDWLESVLCYPMVCLPGKHAMEMLPNRGNGFANGELRAAIDAARDRKEQP